MGLEYKLEYCIKYIKMKLKELLKEYNLRWWIHIGLIAFLVLGTLQIFTKGEMLTIVNWLWSVPLIGISDIISEKVVYGVWKK